MFEDSLVRHIEKLQIEMRKLLQEGRYKPPVFQWNTGGYTMTLLFYGRDPVFVEVDPRDISDLYARPTSMVVPHFCICCRYEFQQGDNFELHKKGGLCPDCSDFAIIDNRDLRGRDCVACGSRLHDPKLFTKHYPFKYRFCCNCFALAEAIAMFPERIDEVSKSFSPKVVHRIKLLISKRF